MIGEDASSGEVGIVFAIIMDACGEEGCVGVSWLVAVRAERRERIRDVLEERVFLAVEEYRGEGDEEDGE